MQCPTCGAFITQEDRFCGECGQKLLTEATPPEALSPLEAKDLPTIGLEAQPRSPSLAPAAPLPGRKRPLTAALLAAGMGLLIACLAVGVLLFTLQRDKTPDEAPVKSLPTAREPIYQDDFEDPASGWDVYTEDNFWAGYADGEYRLGVYQDNYTTWGNPDAEGGFTDFEVEVDARQVEGPLDNNYGLLVRHQPDDDNFYWFQISSDGYYSVDLMRTGEWVTLVGWEASDAIDQGVGAVNRLRVVCDGNRFTFYVNDTFLTEVTDSAFSAGNVGLAIGAFDESGVVVHFDNLKVYALQE
jgi:hypothetical protein